VRNSGRMPTSTINPSATKDSLPVITDDGLARGYAVARLVEGDLQAIFWRSSAVAAAGGLFVADLARQRKLLIGGSTSQLQFRRD